MKPIITSSGLMAALVALSWALPSAASAQNFIVNGGFEDGSTTTNRSNVPDGWTPNAAYSADTAFARVDDNGNAHTGNYNLTIGNYDVDPVDMLSQTFTDVVGGSYTVNFYGFAGRGGDPDAFLTLSAGGNSLTFHDDINAYTLGTFTFVGTGSDTLTIAASTNPGDWYVDDVSITGPAVTGPVPEPASWALMLGGFGMVGGALRSRRPATARLV